METFISCRLGHLVLFLVFVSAETSFTNKISKYEAIAGINGMNQTANSEPATTSADALNGETTLAFTTKLKIVSLDTVPIEQFTEASKMHGATTSPSTITRQFVRDTIINKDDSITTVTSTPEVQCTTNPVITNLTNIEIKPTSINLYVVLGNEDLCTSSSIEVNCISSDTFPWVNNHTNYTLSVPDNKSLLMDGLSEFTTYSCNFNETDNQAFLWKANFTTLEIPPTAPQNVSITQSGAKNFNLTWELPEKYPTTILGYNFTIYRHNKTSESHFLGEGCEPLPEAEWKDFINQTKLLSFSFSYDEILPNFNYSVVMRASSTAGDGEESKATNFSSWNAASDSPRNVTTTLNERCEALNIHRNVTISWEMPCNTNGPVTHFVIELNGTYSYNSKIHETSQFNVSVKSNLSHIFPDLLSASNYNVTIYAINDSEEAIEGISSNVAFETGDNYPNAPQINSYITGNGNVTWKTPTNNPGIVTGYEVKLSYMGLNNWNKTKYCTSVGQNYSEAVTDILWSLPENLIPGAIYSFSVAAVTSVGTGNYSVLSITSLVSAPELINVSCIIQNNTINEKEYNVTSEITIQPGCFNGQFQAYSYVFESSNFKQEEEIAEYTNITYTFQLQPANSYEFSITVKNTEFFVTKSVTFSSSAGVPTFNDSTLSSIEINTTTTDATVVLKKEDFESNRGDILYMAIIISSENVTGGFYNQWDNWKWPALSVDENVTVYYQATPMFWDPFANSNSTEWVIGKNESCQEDDVYCNRPLSPGKTYFLFIRVFNSNFYRNLMPVTIVTAPLSKLALILGLTIGIFFFVSIGFFGFVMWRKGYFNKLVKRQNHLFSEKPLTEISKDNFIEYCDYLEKNPDFLEKQWEELDDKSKKVYLDLKSDYALSPENKRKNRFTNILPFDHTRVKLTNDEDDEISSDYINASYIKGFSGNSEYIATQGPLPDTACEFWKMVFQENVTIIVMVARFIESGKEKCFKYFPNNHESMIFGDDFEVRCTVEIDFEIYCVRTLQVRKDLRQLTVTHMQFLEWPDFGIPQNNDSLLLFCHKMRMRWSHEGGMAVVHCSAGVGRTGTIIALDILTQALKEGGNVDVFNTVLELRKQRKNMVQTTKQYMYIYQLLRSILENPIGDDEDSEHVYQNVKLPPASLGKNTIVESAL
ncbi:receptor-type tyrosine-protein phosphatase H-like isoform X2 [Euwallacea similis]|uniref:receptor-type tyrosine-protein phosphatase H-like isoform X2 n=1 Tax=Euwallacea similis TaxID=1736056 RepID=UPI00344E06EE